MKLQLDTAQRLSRLDSKINLDDLCNHANENSYDWHIHWYIYLKELVISKSYSAFAVFIET